MRLGVAMMILFLPISAVNGAQTVVAPADANSAEQWIGVMPDRDTLKPLAEALARAMNRKDDAAIKAIIAQTHDRLGPYVGVPEERPIYGQPINDRPPELKTVAARLERSYSDMSARAPWAVTLTDDAPPPARLRVGLRLAEVYMRGYEAGLGPAYLAEARRAFDYMLLQQAPSGVFGYPYNPRNPRGLEVQALKLVEEGQRRGVTMVHGGWVIDDLGRGDLNFDNGVVGAGLLQAYTLTGDKRYLAGGRRAAEWAAARPFSSNFNYNSFSGYLLARLYRVSGDRSALERSREIFRYAVFPGQLPNGRWIDQHNAKIQYHAVMMRHAIEFYLALREDGDTLAAAEVKGRIVRGLDNMAAQIIAHGSSNTHELLATEALSLGLMVLGENPAWSRAAAIDVNYLLDHFEPRLREVKRPLSEPLAAYLLYRASKCGVSPGLDVRSFSEVRRRYGTNLTPKLPACGTQG